MKKTKQVKTKAPAPRPAAPAVLAHVVGGVGVIPHTIRSTADAGTEPEDSHGIG